MIVHVSSQTPQHAPTSQPLHLLFLSAWILKEKEGKFFLYPLRFRTGVMQIKLAGNRSTGEKAYTFSFMLILLPGGVGRELLRKEVKVPKKQLGLKAYIPF